MTAIIPRKMIERLDKVKQLPPTKRNDQKRRNDLVRLFKNKKQNRYLPFQLMRRELQYFENMQPTQKGLDDD